MSIKFATTSSPNPPLPSPFAPFMASAVADAAPTSPNPPAPPKRIKKKVRVQELIEDEQLTKPVDTFHVHISDVRAVLRVAEARPVLLTFEFDNYWYAETDVWADNVEPIWGFNAASIHGHDGRKPMSADGEDKAPLRGIVTDAKFVYETEFGYKLHRKFLIVKLAERSPYGDVEWGQGIIPLDSVARGCPTTDVSIIAKDGVTCYGIVTCSIAMTNVQTVRAHLTDIKLSEYPEAYNYDVKLIYLEFGYNGFEAGYHRCTEKRSDGEPRFSAQPALEFDTTLRDMLASSSSGSRPLQMYFSVHRQVARNRTEEIGVGALPVRMLFPKVREGWMDLPTKFKVPLANYKGIIRGKILLRNIPQFSQLPGDDLVNADGNILPHDVDLTARKILPWVKLPKSWEQRSRPVMPSTPTWFGPREMDWKGSATTNGYSQSGTNGVARAHGHGYVTAGQYYSSMTESASDGGSESSASSPRRRAAQVNYDYRVAGNDLDTRRASIVQSRYITAEANCAVKPSTSPLTVRDQIYEAEAEVSYGAGADVESNRQNNSKDAQQIGASGAGNAKPQFEWMRGMTKEEELGTEPEEEKVTVWEKRWTQEVGKHREENMCQWNRFAKMNLSEAVVLNEGEGGQWSDPNESGEMLQGFRGRRSKSGKSIGSTGTAEAGVEIGSAVLSVASDDGHGTASRTTTEDALTMSQRLSTGPPSEENYEVESEGAGMEEIGEGEMTMGEEIGREAANVEDSVTGNGDVYEHDDGEREWTAILDRSSGRYFFAHKYTQESLWLPPGWERVEDDDGREYFIDHGKQRTQRGFPALEAKAYRESVYTGR